MAGANRHFIPGYIRQGGDGAYQLRESAACYGTHFKAEKKVIGHKNTLFWDLKYE